MNPQELFSTIQEQVNQFLPDAAKAAQEDIHNNIKLVVASVISKLDLVSREEFDTQTAVLEKTRTMLEQMELRVADLEKQLGEVPDEA